jgi:hypothetical protein
MNQNIIMHRMLQKWTSYLVQKELQNSSIDLRAIHSKKVEIDNFVKAINPYEYQREHIIYKQCKKKKNV